METPIVINVNATNRDQRRKVVKEFNRNIRRLEDLEIAFAELLFKDNDFTYKELYSITLENFTTTINWMEKMNYFKYTKPDKEYFYRLYAPID